MPGTTTFGATVRYDSNIFLVGGTNNYYIPRSLTNIEIFNAHTEQFEHSYYMIDGVYLFPALLLDNVLYILGGAGDLPRATVQVCDVHLRSKHLDGGIMLVIYIVVPIVILMLCIVLLCVYKYRKVIQRKLNVHKIEKIENNSLSTGLLQMHAK
eukprot:515792_1